MINNGETLEMDGILSNRAELISISRRPGTVSGEKSSGNKWVSSYCIKQTNPV